VLIRCVIIFISYFFIFYFYLTTRPGKEYNICYC
jgi:hypothetical protein